jgi:hypothetical protein
MLSSYCHASYYTFALYALHYFNCVHLCIYDRSSEPKTKIQAEQVQWVFEGPQVSSCEDANIAFVSRQALMHLTIALVFYFETLLYILLDCALSL